ncbi:MAG: GNAT family N-acetyltransferase [Pirellulaceae bacterium]
MKLTSDRLNIRPVESGDAEFILEILNDPDFIEFTFDRKIRSLEAASEFLENGPLAVFNERGIGLFVIELGESQSPVGITSLTQRDYLPQPDVGFVVLPEYRGQGIATEAAQLTIDYARQELGIDPLYAMASADNERSIAILKKLGMTFEESISTECDCCTSLFKFDPSKSITDLS